MTIKALLSVDEQYASNVTFLVLPKVGDKIGFWKGQAQSHARVTGLRHEFLPNGAGTFVIDARSVPNDALPAQAA